MKRGTKFTIVALLLYVVTIPADVTIVSAIAAEAPRPTPTPRPRPTPQPRPTPGIFRGCFSFYQRGRERAGILPYILIRTLTVLVCARTGAIWSRLRAPSIGASSIT